jgi:hypothetical protein
MGYVRISVPALLLSMLACGAQPTAPTSASAKPDGPPTPNVSCTSDPDLRCRVFVYGEGDVTNAASWSAADSFRLAMDVPVTPSDAVVFKTPGVPTVLRSANIYIRADYDSPRYGHLRAAAFNEYAVAPLQAAVPLAYLSGFVRADGVDNLADATVEIISGPDAGKRATSNSVGFYMVEFVPLGQPFTIRASKPGYTSDTQDHGGIVNDSAGFPSNATIHFQLKPLT